MADSTTITIRVSTALKDKLDRLAHDTRRSRSFLAAEAVGIYVDRELEIIAGIERGLDDVRHGRVVAHDEAAARINATLAEIERKRPA